MYVERTTKSGGVTVAPALPNDPLLDAVHALRPGLLLDVQSRYLAATGADVASAFKALNVADDTVLSLFSTHRPELLAGGKGLRFGPNIGLVREDGGALDMSGSYTLAWLARVSAGSGGMVVGQQQAAGQSWAGYDYSTGAMMVVHGGAPYVIGAVELDDGQWHMGMAAYDATLDELSIYIDGAYAATATGVTTGWGAEGRLIVGALGATGADAYFAGDIGGLVVLPGQCLHNADQIPARNAVHVWLGQVKTRMTAA